jgi:CubicO group peptidase (beta-lactamase class C family)
VTRRRAEAAFAVLFAVGIMLVGGAAFYFVSTISVHLDHAALQSTAADVHVERYSGAVDESRRLSRSLVVEENLPGLSVAVAVDGEIVWAEGFGWADIEARAPVTPLTLFRLGSVSKTLTAAAVALLYERGRVDLDVIGHRPAGNEHSRPVGQARGRHLVPLLASRR